MALSEMCGACGCDLTDAESQPNGAIRHGTVVYCAECARLILSPEELMPADKPPSPPRPATPPRPQAGKAASASLDDDWFAIPKSEKPGEATVEMPADKPSPARKETSGHAPDKAGQAEEASEEAPNAGESSADSENEDEPEAADPIADDKAEAGPKRKPLRRLGQKKPEAKQPVKKSGVRPGVKPVVKRSLLENEDEDEKEKDVPPVKSGVRLGVKPEPAPERGESRPGRPSGRTLARAKEKDAAAERDPARRRTTVGTTMSSSMLIGIGVGLFFVLALIVYYGFSDSSAPEKKAEQKTHVEEENDTTPSDDYARRAKAEQNAGHIADAATLYVRAANAAEREGRPTAAQKYTTTAYDLRKNLHLDLAGSRR